MKHQDNSQDNNNLLMALGAGIVGAVVYKLFVSPRGADRREQIANMAHEAKDAVSEKIRHTRAVAQEDFDEIVDEVVESYSRLRHVGSHEATALRNELKKSWGRIEQAANKETNKNIDTISQTFRKHS